MVLSFSQAKEQFQHILANPGGVMANTFLDVHATAEELKAANCCTAAYVHALKRIASVIEAKGTAAYFKM